MADRTKLQGDTTQRTNVLKYKFNVLKYKFNVLKYQKTQKALCLLLGEGNTRTENS